MPVRNSRHLADLGNQLISKWIQFYLIIYHSSDRTWLVGSTAGSIWPMWPMHREQCSWILKRWVGIRSFASNFTPKPKLSYMKSTDLFECRFFDIPVSILPEIRSSSEIYGYLTKHLAGIPISGVRYIDIDIEATIKLWTHLPCFSPMAVCGRPTGRSYWPALSPAR